MMNQIATLAFFLITASIVTATNSNFHVRDKREGECDGANPGEIVYLPVAGQCDKYIECYNGEGTMLQCPDGLWWHPEIENCDYPGDFCVSHTTTPPGPTTTLTPTTPAIGPDPRCVDGNTDYWSHPVFCNKYIECYEGDSYEMACPPGLYFSDSLKECVNSEESECCVTNAEC